MSLLKSAIKFKAAKTVTNKAFGNGTISTLAAAKMTQKSNARGNARRAGRK
ncbi:hypothetical protein AB6819_14515 [Carnobacterium maltaromaticum]|uniref:hypothetical protein n=1 Tax=Carnobacterium maltaromaticum TaxID=2751 RepID=UPI002092B589